MPRDQMAEGGRTGILLSFSLVLSHSTASCSVTVTSSVLQFWCLLGYFLASQGAGWMKALSVSIPISCTKTMRVLYDDCLQYVLLLSLFS